jgi:hypothetical protein
MDVLASIHHTNHISISSKFYLIPLLGVLLNGLVFPFSLALRFAIILLVHSTLAPLRRPEGLCSRVGVAMASGLVSHVACDWLVQ